MNSNRLTAVVKSNAIGNIPSHLNTSNALELLENTSTPQNFALRVNRTKAFPYLEIISIAEWTLKDMNETVEYLMMHHLDIFHQQDTSDKKNLIEKLRSYKEDHQDDTSAKIDDLFKILNLN